MLSTSISNCMGGVKKYIDSIINNIIFSFIPDHTNLFDLTKTINIYFK